MLLHQASAKLVLDKGNKTLRVFVLWCESLSGHVSSMSNEAILEMQRGDALYLRQLSEQASAFQSGLVSFSVYAVFSSSSLPSPSSPPPSTPIQPASTWQAWRQQAFSSSFHWSLTALPVLYIDIMDMKSMIRKEILTYQLFLVSVSYLSNTLIDIFIFAQKFNSYLKLWITHFLVIYPDLHKIQPSLIITHQSLLGLQYQLYMYSLYKQISICFCSHYSSS